MKVAELKEELSKRGQPTTGLKTVLADRLKEALQSRLPVIAMSNQQVSTQSNQPQHIPGFMVGARWKPLIPNAVAVIEPTNASQLMHAPTIHFCLFTMDQLAIPTLPTHLVGHTDGHSLPT